jgi:hypothetical protein
MIWLHNVELSDIKQFKAQYDAEQTPKPLKTPHMLVIFLPGKCLSPKSPTLRAAFQLFKSRTRDEATAAGHRKEYAALFAKERKK